MFLVCHVARLESFHEVLIEIGLWRNPMSIEKVSDFLELMGIQFLMVVNKVKVNSVPEIHIY